LTFNIDPAWIGGKPAAAAAFHARRDLDVSIKAAITPESSGAPRRDMDSQTDADLKILGQTELFRGLDRRVLAEARDASFRKTLATGETLFHQGEPVSTLYVVTAGRLRATQTTADGQQVIIRYIGPGELAGYTALSGGEEHPGTTAAVEETQLIGWNAPAIRALMARNAALAMNAVAVLGARYHDMQLRLREVATERVEQRIVHAILRLARSAGRPTPRGIEIAIPLSRQDLAELAGTTLYTVSRVLSGWEESGLVDIGRRRVTICNAPALERIAAR
jgi:CRP-like cAMP-binding protein